MASVNGGSGGGNIDPAILSTITSDILANQNAISANSAQIALNCEGIGINDIDIGALASGILAN